MKQSGYRIGAGAVFTLLLLYCIKLAHPLVQPEQCELHEVLVAFLGLFILHGLLFFFTTEGGKSCGRWRWGAVLLAIVFIRAFGFLAEMEDVSSIINVLPGALPSLLVVHGAAQVCFTYLCRRFRTKRQEEAQ